MTTFGVTDLGLLIPRLQDLIAEFEDELRNEFGPTIDLSVESVEGQFTGMTSERLARVWEALEVLASVLDDGAARGRLLDALCALTGTYRRPPTFSVIMLALAGGVGTTVAGASLLSNGQPAFQFTTIDDANLLAVPARTADTPYAIGDRVKNGGNVYEAHTGGTSGHNSSPTLDFEPLYAARPISLSAPLILEGPAFAAPDGNIVWIWLGAGDAAASVQARAVAAGPVFVAALGLTTIDTPISGWSAVVNLVDVTPGANVQTDTDLAGERVVEIAALGTSPPDALRGRLLRVGVGGVNPVTAVTIFRNTGDLTDGDGIPPHATEAMVRGGADADIRTLLWSCVASGLVTHGNVSGTITDSEGNLQTIKFSRPTVLNIYVDVALVKNPLLYPLDGDVQVKAAIVAYGAAQATGKDVVASRIIAAVFSILGVLDVTVVKIGTAPAPGSSATIAISLRQLAVYDTSRINVTSSNGVP